MKTQPGIYKILTDPASEPITTADMKTHLRVSHSDDDTYIDSLIVAARVYIEAQYDIAINTQTIVEYFDDWMGTDGDSLVLTVGPVASITSVKYYDTDNAEQTLNASNYSADLVSRYARIKINTNASAPAVYERPSAIFVEYVAGTDATPSNIAHAMKLIVGDWYRDRERTPGNVKARLLDTVQTLLNVYK